MNDQHRAIVVAACSRVSCTGKQLVVVADVQQPPVEVAETGAVSIMGAVSVAHPGEQGA